MYMVSTITVVMNLRSTYSRRDRAKASMPVQNRLSRVIITVLEAEIHAAWYTALSDRMDS